ncbi:Hypothetical protein A7982_08464 [Minicystis rosea]|nr:Hypothetical protein A7982_08464 [Minicystis rosea]
MSGTGPSSGVPASNRHDRKTVDIRYLEKRSHHRGTAFNGIMRSVDVAAAVNAATGTFPNYPSIAMLPAPSSFQWCEDATSLFAPAATAR